MPSDDLDDLGAPTCERCLLPMEDVEGDHGPYWRCPQCGGVRIAA